MIEIRKTFIFRIKPIFFYRFFSSGLKYYLDFPIEKYISKLWEEKLKMNFTKKNKQRLLYKPLALGVLSLVVLLSFFAARQVTKLKTHYSASQFQPKKHQLLERDKKISELYDIQSSSPHVLKSLSRLLTFPRLL